MYAKVPYRSLLVWPYKRITDSPKSISLGRGCPWQSLTIIMFSSLMSLCAIPKECKYSIAMNIPSIIFLTTCFFLVFYLMYVPRSTPSISSYTMCMLSWSSKISMISTIFSQKQLRRIPNSVMWISSSFVVIPHFLKDLIATLRLVYLHVPSITLPNEPSPSTRPFFVE